MKCEGIHYVRTDGYAKNGLDRRKRKPTLAELKGLQAMLAESQEISDRLRKRVGLEPVPPNHYRRALAEEIARREGEALPARRKPDTGTNPLDLVREASAKRERARRAEARANREIVAAVEAAREAGESMSAIARAVGCSRPSLYELVAKG